MSPKGSHSWKGKATARAKIQTSVVKLCLVLDRDHMMGFLSAHIRGLIRIYNVWGLNDERAWELSDD
jgi:hypothetical protein